MFQQPRRGPGRPSKSTTELPASSTPETPRSFPEEPSIPSGPDSSTRSPRDGGDSSRANGTSGDSPGNEPPSGGLIRSIQAQIVNATEAAHNLATDDVGRAFGQFLVSETEAMELSEASARLISRKVPKGFGNSDLEDYARIGVAVVSYVGRQISIWKKARSARHQMASAVSGHDGEEQAA
jgi:hypothetical protein